MGTRQKKNNHIVKYALFSKGYQHKYNFAAVSFNVFITHTVVLST